ncbi:MAG: putative metalloprotease CJM1_0395 family protein [Mucispirillum sp.]|nr:putative metalloprotease CJM1_0395 family protein [Mucispirillum sp.]
MSVSALTNSFYNYVPVTSSQYDTSSTNNASNSQAQENVKAVDEKSVQTQATSSTYKENNENTSSNNSNNNENTSSYLTGEEILASRPEKSSSSDKQLTEEEQKQIDELKARDREVKTHEQAHIVAGGSYVKGGATYDYQTGPDGKQYAVGGSVNIDTSPVDGDPEATIAKAQVVIKAALAPAEPSGQDQKVASAARQMMSEARKELTSQNNAEINVDTNTDTENTTGSVEESSDTSNKETAAVNTDSSTSSANTNISSKESADKANNTDNTSNTAATQAPVQNLRESNVTSIQQKNNQNITAASYNIGSLISLTA